MCPADAQELYHEVHGEQGPWLTLLHGGLAASPSWDRQVRDLSPNLVDFARVLTCDLRGYGRTPRSQDVGVDPPAMAADVVALWDQIGVEAATVIGFSMGGFVAQELALSVPERVTALVLVSTTSRLSDAGQMAFRGRAETLEKIGLDRELDTHLSLAFSARFHDEQPELLAEYRRHIVANDPTVIADTFRALARYDRSDTAGEISCPTLVICGEEDGHLGPAAARPLAASISDAELVVVPGVGHTLQVENPNAFNRLVADFHSRRVAG